MKPERKTVGIICGGKSHEHSVSLHSAYNIQSELNRKHYDVLVIGIDKNGAWQVGEASEILKYAHSVKEAHLPEDSEEVFLHRGGQLVTETGELKANIDVFFPITHGKFGEDGSLQGCLDMSEVPYVGSDVYGSATAMDKEVTKCLLQSSGVGIVPYLCLRNNESVDFKDVRELLGSPVFVKPAREGSSIGVSKAENQEQFAVALKEAFLLDNKVLIEQAVVSREIECAVLGNQSPEAATVLGEVVPIDDFYSYDAKYISATGAKLLVPAPIEEAVAVQIREIAIKAFQTTGCTGMARVDFFLTADQRIMINEINTLPGFTKISMYPKLWQKSGLPYSDLLDRLIELALEKT